jgi:hypothetical protein
MQAKYTACSLNEEYYSKRTALMAEDAVTLVAASGQGPERRPAQGP